MNKTMDRKLLEDRKKKKKKKKLGTSGSHRLEPSSGIVVISRRRIDSTRGTLIP